MTNKDFDANVSVSTEMEVIIGAKLHLSSLTPAHPAHPKAAQKPSGEEIERCQ